MTELPQVKRLKDANEAVSLNSAEVIQLGTLLRQASTENSTMKKTLDSFKDEKQSLIDGRETRDQELDSLKAVLVTTTETIAVLREKNDTTTVGREKSQSECSSLRSQLKERDEKSRLQGGNESVDSLKAVLVTTTETIGVLREKNDTTTAELEKSQPECSSLRSQLNERDEKSRLQGGNESAASQEKEHGKMTLLVASNKEAQAKIKSLQDKLEEVKEAVALSNLEVLQLEVLLQQATTDRDTIQKALGSLKDEKQSYLINHGRETTMDQKIDSAEADLRTATETIDMLSDKNETSTAELEKVQLAFASLRSELNESEKSRFAFSQECETLRDGNAHLLASNEKARAETEALQDRFEKANRVGSNGEDGRLGALLQETAAALSMTRKAVEPLKYKKERMIQDCEITVDQTTLEAELLTATEAFDMLRQKNGMITAVLDKAQSSCASLRSELKQSEKSRGALSQECGVARGKLQDTQNDVLRLEKHMKELGLERNELTLCLRCEQQHPHSPWPVGHEEILPPPHSF
jgi:chromosome segregation ATPase